MNNSPEKIIIDTDPAIGVPGRDVDDGLAIALALNSPELEVIGLTVTYGNVNLERALSCARRVLREAGREDIPILRGAASKRDLGRGTPASEFIASQIARRPGEITLVPIAPLTNCATAEMLAPGTLASARRIVCMGGAVRKRGNMPPAFRAEFNFWCDPPATKLFIERAARLTLVPFDLTQTVIFDLPHLQALGRASSSFAQYLYRNIISWFALNIPFSLAMALRAGFMPHDPLAIGAMLWPEIYEFKEETLEVISSGLESGRSKPAPGGSPVSVACKVGQRQFLDRLIERLTKSE